MRIDARGRVAMPALVDCHTHACWAGDRFGEWELKRAGASYLEVLKAGGGILSTVEAVRAAPAKALASRLAERLAEMRATGTGAVEVKTGYGLDAANELKMLEAILAVQAVWPAPVVPTLLLGHALDASNPRQVDDMCSVLERAADLAPGAAVDAYCEDGAWSVAMCRTLFGKARRLGVPVRLHADQFNALGGLELALEFGARSVDHLEASAPAGLAALAIFAVGLLASAFVPMAYCRHACPTGALLDHLRLNRKSGSFTWRDGVLLGCLAAAAAAAWWPA
jgi:imidazolonepropionase